MLLAELDANEGQEQWKEKISILLADGAGGVPSPKPGKVQSARLMKIISDDGERSGKATISIYSRALLTLIKDGLVQSLHQCGQPIERPLPVLRMPCRLQTRVRQLRLPQLPFPVLLNCGSRLGEQSIRSKDFC